MIIKSRIRTVGVKKNRVVTTLVAKKTPKILAKKKKKRPLSPFE